MIVGERLTVTIEKPVAGGRMLARHRGAVILVSGALPGECVEVEVDRLQKHVAWASVRRIVESSRWRVGEPNPCGGCVFAHAEAAYQRVLKQQIVADALRRLARLDMPAPEVVPSPAAGYRMRARLHVDGERAGFLIEGTHRICDPAATGQLLPATAALLAELAVLLARGAPGAVAGIALAENRAADERGVHIELSAGADPSALGRVVPAAGVTSLSWSHAGHRRVHVVVGDGGVTETLTTAGLHWAVARRTRSFFQSNRFLLAPLVDDVCRRVHQGPVLDLYAGVGLFAGAAAAAGHRPVTAVEADESAAADLRQNAASWGRAVEARRETVEAFLARRRGAHPASVILDPPRTGLTRPVLAGLAALRAPRLIYVSCDAPTFARDLHALGKNGYVLSALRAYDLFPNTPHIEVVATLDLAQ